MHADPTFPHRLRSRRSFLQQSASALAATSLTATLASRVHAAEDHTIKVALVGCGGRGTGAGANALSTAGPTRLVALADVFQHRLDGCHRTLSDQFGDQVDVPEDRRFLGLDAFRKAIDCLDPGDVVLLATAPAFRPQHLEYAVEKGCHVFMEKSFAVDAPGIRRVLAAGKRAEEKNLKIVGGLMCRHNLPLQAAIHEVHEGTIGLPITGWIYRMHGAVGIGAKQPGMSELAYQVANYSCFTWVNGSFFVDWLIHNIDVGCWVMDGWPVSAQGQGGRQVRQAADQMFDHYAVEFTFADGRRLLAQGRHQDNTWGFFGNVIHGTTGCGVLGEGISRPELYRGHNAASAHRIWQHEGSAPSPYQVEMDVLFEAIRNDTPHNETERCAMACMTAILGRMAAFSGGTITFEEALASNRELAPGLDELSWDDDPPVMPDEDGNYPIAMPGYTDVL